MEVGLDEGAVAEEVLVQEILGVLGSDVEHAEGEALGRIGLGFGAHGTVGAFGELVLVEKLHQTALGAGDPEREPVFVDEALDEDLLGGGAGLEILKHVVAQGFEVSGGFEGKYDGLRGEPVFEGVEPGARFAGGGLRAGGFLRVAAIGVDLSLRGHGSSVFRVTGGRKFPGAAAGR